ncbi:MAG TPA: AEC family transporter [Candidatus Acidoferrum sp.]|nr:AEC family transporter [Candidatus Acidoferrum sp.]
MNVSGLVGALLPVFFVLALGYGAGKGDAFDANQAAGLSKLAVSFALPASLFVGMTEIPRNLLLQQGRLVLALMLAHVGLFFVAWVVLGFIQSLRGTPAILYALMLSTSATPVFGLAVLRPILGPTATGAVGLVALSINLVVPATVVLLEVDAAKHRGIAKERSNSNPVLTGLASGLKSPLLWAPIVGIGIVLAKVPLPRVIAACFQLIGSTTSGVAVFAVGLVLAAHAFQFSRVVFLGTLGRLVVQNVVLLVLLRLLHVDSPFAREALICCSFPLATVVVLFAARYKSSESETASMLLFSTLSLAITVPIILWLTHHWPV